MQQIFELLLARGDLESWCLSSQLSMLSRSYRDTAAEWRRTATKFDLEFNYHHKQTINFAALMRDCTRLRRLTLSQHIGDGKAVASILRRNPQLERVELRRPQRIAARRIIEGERGSPLLLHKRDGVGHKVALVDRFGVGVWHKPPATPRDRSSLKLRCDNTGCPCAGPSMTQGRSPINMDRFSKNT